MRNGRWITEGLVAVALLAGGAVGLSYAATPPSSSSAVPATKVSGGHVTKPVDKGRPVVLVASALGVPESVFRDAFSRVKPAPAGSEPDPEQVNENKAQLLSVLGPYGVTNEELDRVSNYYRYSGAAGEMWPTKAAVLRATMRGDKVVGIRVVSGGNGYTSAPKVTVAGHPEVVAKAKLGFSKTFGQNGRVVSVSVSTR